MTYTIHFFKNSLRNITLIKEYVNLKSFILNNEMTRSVRPKLIGVSSLAWDSLVEKTWVFFSSYWNRKELSKLLLGNKAFGT